MSALSCDGGCRTSFEGYGANPPGHQGEVRRVRVSNGLHDWDFAYYEEAIRRDREKGLAVEIVDAEQKGAQ